MLTQYFFINQNAPPKHAIAAIKGLTFVPVAATRLSPTTPEIIATILFTVVIIPNIESRLILLLSRLRAKYSVTIQDSKTLYIRVVLNPPSSLPINSMMTSSEIFVRHPRAYATQKARHASRRPYLSAREPTKRAEIAAERNPQVNKAATTDSARFFSSL